ncbi:glycosyltransferase family 2 protein [Amaricoccus sp.]|uniref:glycosyltransferase family 2 protein n=1 Tax=Amaricoccus sp. TaxID=1872485 RepID=UPI001B572756|nr:glycosyltransferase family 2 protein [Amaricoccus sp.]MBP7242729.1 glycosyltransferase [Amaricoccus sp.]
MVRSGKLAPEKLSGALALQRQWDVRLGHILLVDGLISREDLVEALSDQSNLGPADLDSNLPEPELARGVDPYLCLKLEAIPWRRHAGRTVIAIASPDDGAAALALLSEPGVPTALAIAPADAIRRAIGRQFGARMAMDAERRCPTRFSCRDMLSAGLTFRKSVLLAALAIGAALAPLSALRLLLAVALLANLATTFLRLAALAARWRLGPPPTVAGPRLADHRKRPSVSLLVPLKGEAAVARQLLTALGGMAYPAPLLDIKLVLEAGDADTHVALLEAGLPPTVEIVTVPRGTIQTKPRAMNYALPFCRGEIVGVYDAEDLPDPGQILAVVNHFANAPPEVACVQGYLDFYNQNAGWIARLFTLEYAVWFRLLLQGVARLGMPIPLGGTTVFFRRAALEDAGCWDAHNVTEDADLGMRLARRGYRTEMIPTTTEEEANAAGMRKWIGQRSRWLKGYAITWAVHMREPVTLWRELGPLGFAGFQVILLGSVASYLTAPLLLGLLVGVLGVPLPLLSEIPDLARHAIVASLAAGSIVWLACAVVALRDSNRLHTLCWLWLQPVYTLLGTAAAWRAVAEAVHAPFHWQKTEHGRSLRK